MTKLPVCLHAILAGFLVAAPLTGIAGEDAMPPLQDAATEYARHDAAPPGRQCTDGEIVTLPVSVNDDAPLDVEFEPAGNRLRMRYRMNFNDITEGWNWHPLDAAEGGEYYLFKYLPAGTVVEDRGRYRGEDKIGSPQEFAVQWRNDYFFAFANHDDFYPRATDDETAFAAEAVVTPEMAEHLTHGDLRMALRGRLDGDCLSSSTTFWKATAAKPVDFTLKKRYLIGRLTEVWFYDAASGRVLARVAAGAATARR